MFIQKLSFLSLFALTGCGGVLDPAGPVGNGERIILLDSLAIMLAIVIPTIVLTLGVAWWFRSSNTKAKYRPEWTYSGQLELLIWSIPALVVLFLGGIAWISSHDLDPLEPLSTTVMPLEVEVVSLDWKWLFIYPEQKIASINYLAAPVGMPIHFKITSASVMNVFFVPRLGSEIYAMSGMVTDLNLQADKPGVYPGLSGHFSGDGFSGMAFNLEAMSQDQFKAWIASARSSKEPLNEAAYRHLLVQSTDEKPRTFSSVDDDLFHDIVTLKLPPGDGPTIGRPDPSVSPRQDN